MQLSLTSCQKLNIIVHFNCLQMRPCWILNPVMRRKPHFFLHIVVQTANTWSGWFSAQSRKNSGYYTLRFSYIALCFLQLNLNDTCMADTCELVDVSTIREQQRWRCITHDNWARVSFIRSQLFVIN